MDNIKTKLSGYKSSIDNKVSDVYGYVKSKGLQDMPDIKSLTNAQKIVIFVVLSISVIGVIYYVYVYNIKENVETPPATLDNIKADNTKDYVDEVLKTNIDRKVAVEEYFKRFANETYYKKLEDINKDNKFAIKRAISVINKKNKISLRTDIQINKKLNNTFEIDELVEYINAYQTCTRDGNKATPECISKDTKNASDFLMILMYKNHPFSMLYDLSRLKYPGKIEYADIKRLYSV